MTIKLTVHFITNCIYAYIIVDMVSSALTLLASMVNILVLFSVNFAIGSILLCFTDSMFPVVVYRLYGCLFNGVWFPSLLCNAWNRTQKQSSIMPKSYLIRYILTPLFYFLSC